MVKVQAYADNPCCPSKGWLFATGACAGALELLTSTTSEPLRSTSGGFLNGKLCLVLSLISLRRFLMKSSVECLGQLYALCVSFPQSLQNQVYQVEVGHPIAGDGPSTRPVTNLSLLFAAYSRLRFKHMEATRESWRLHGRCQKRL